MIEGGKTPKKAYYFRMLRFVITSDTHGFHRGMKMPDGDVLIHCGDFSRDYGAWMDTVRFASWMAKQPHKHKILCAGNHDYAIHEAPTKALTLFKEHGVHMLGMHPVEIQGITIDGGPWMPISPSNPSWGFEMEPEERETHWSRIKKADVLVSHSPPMGILDRNERGTRVGCEVLRKHVFRIKPTIHCFGHVHECRGSYQENGIGFINASSNTRGNFVRDELNGITHMTMSVRDAIVYDLRTSNPGGGILHGATE
jgi:Icc-related predicted phosphoesterase